MNVALILERLKASGLHIKAEGGNLRVGPKESVTPETLELVRAHKAELLEAVGKRVADHAEAMLSRHWRWLFHYPDGSAVENRILPEPTEQELRTRHPDVVRFERLTDTLQ